MPKPYPYACRLDSILKRARKYKRVDQLRRGDIEDIFGVQKTAAVLIMKAVGNIGLAYERPVVLKDDLERFLQAAIAAVTVKGHLSLKDEAAAVNKRFSAFMTKKLKSRSSVPRFKKLSVTIPRTSLMVRELPVSIRISQGFRDDNGEDELRIKYHNGKGLLERLAELSQAAQYDLPTFESLTEPPPPPRKPDPEIERLRNVLRKLEENRGTT